MIDDFKNDAFFEEKKKEVKVKHKGKDIVFYAHTISYFSNQNIAVQAAANNKNGLALLVAECVTDKDGNKFTYDEILKLKQEYAKPLFEAALDVNAIGGTEKK